MPMTMMTPMNEEMLKVVLVISSAKNTPEVDSSAEDRIAAGAENVRRFAEKVRKLTEDHHFNFEQKDIAVTISLGVSDMTGDMTEPLQFIKGADANLYKAKKSGRNRVQG